MLKIMIMYNNVGAGYQKSLSAINSGDFWQRLDTGRGNLLHEQYFPCSGMSHMYSRTPDTKRFVMMCVRVTCQDGFKRIYLPPSPHISILLKWGSWEVKIKFCYQSMLLYFTEFIVISEIVYTGILEYNLETHVALRTKFPFETQHAPNSLCWVTLHLCLLWGKDGWTGGVLYLLQYMWCPWMQFFITYKNLILDFLQVGAVHLYTSTNSFSTDISS